MGFIEVKAPAKINLFLKVLGRRPDGYHEIYSWFQAVDLFDYLFIERTDKSKFNLLVDPPVGLPEDGSNLIIKASLLLFEQFNLPGGLNIRLKKNIPIAAGLGGGSSDAAATIYAISRLFNLTLEASQMKALGLLIGSDVPFFFSSGQAEVTGRGENITDISLPTDYSILLGIPPLKISTAESYRLLNLGLTTGKGLVKLSCCSNFEELLSKVYDIGNDFEIIHLASYPILGKIKGAIDKAGARLTRMSGSGPTIFGLFDMMPEREDLFQITRGDWQVVRVRPITLPAWD